jgi:predicted secreted protein
MDEQSYVSGARAAWTQVLRQAMQELDAGEKTIAALVLEREAAVAALRALCAKHGDNEWDESLHLADIIEKHLGRHLDQRTG